jgi:hypothetical protein
MGEVGATEIHPAGTAKVKSPAPKDVASSARPRKADSKSGKKTRAARMV